MTALGLAFAALIGLSLGLLGGGGSILTVPVLVYVLGIPAKGANAMLDASRASRVPQATLKRAFGVCLLLMGAFVLYQNHTVFL